MATAQIVYSTIMENKDFIRSLVKHNSLHGDTVERETLDPFLAYMDKIDADEFKRCWDISREYSPTQENMAMLSRKYTITKANTDMLIALLLPIGSRR
jgi:hypothetical protein